MKSLTGHSRRAATSEQPSVKVESPLFHIMPHNAIVEQRFQLAILFHQIVKKDKQKYSAFSPAFLSLQFAELLGYLLK